MEVKMLTNHEQGDDRNDSVKRALSATKRWIEDVLQSPLQLEPNFRCTLSSGVVLCRLINNVLPGTIKRINHCPNRAAATDNLMLFLTACEENFGVLRSRLFSVADFEDIFERESESTPSESSGIEHSENVLIALFWLAKAIEQHPDCKNVRLLDYTAFSGLLPKPVIYHTPVCSTSDYDNQRTRIPSILERKSSYIVEPALEPHHFVRPHSSNTMGNNSSQPISDVALHKQASPSLQRAQTLPLQTNNSALDEDEWQANLDDWREKRRKASRLQATRMFSLEEQKREEERKQQAAIRARMQEIKNHRTSVTSSYIPSIDISQPPPISSPGMALLTGAAFDLSEISDDSVFNSIAPYGSFSRMKETRPVEENYQDQSVNIDVGEPEEPTTETLAFDRKGIQNGFNSDMDGTIHLEPTTAVSYKPDFESQDFSQHVLPDDFRCIVIRLQPKSGVVETRWGMTIKAQGPTSSAPFVVDKVKIGSSADVCDVLKGDILVQLNETDLRSSATNPSFTLNKLEDLMDQLTVSGRTASLTVMRKMNEQDEFSDVESIADSEVDHLLLNAPSGDRKGAKSSPGIDDGVAPMVIPSVAEAKVHVTQSNEMSSKKEAPPVPPFAQSITLSNEQPVFSNSSTTEQTKRIPVSFRQDVTEDSRDEPDQKPVSSSNSPPTKHVKPYVPTLRSSLSAQIVNAVEAGASQLSTPSQLDESIQTRTGSIQSTHRAEISGTEPTYMDLATTILSDDVQSDYKITSSPTLNNDAQATVLSGSQYAVANTVSQVDPSKPLLDPRSAISPLPPPPPLPLPPNPASQSTKLFDELKLEFHPLNHFTSYQPATISQDEVYQAVSEGEPELLSSLKPNAHISSLPSPPPPQFFSPPPSEPDMFVSNEDVPINGSGIGGGTSHEDVPLGTPRSQQGVPWSTFGDLMFRNSVPIRVDLSTRSDPNSLRNLTAARNITPSPELPTNPPPAPSAPLLPPLSTRRPQTRPTNVVPLSESTELVIDDYDNKRDTDVYKRHDPHTRMYTPPPFSPVKKPDSVPPPPKIPMNKLVNQKQKCIACTRELGSGDLMLIESMSLYYHLACFVCSRCGVALSDGLSNTDVRIRGGQLYCNDCYPSRHAKTMQQNIGSHRNHNTPARSGISFSCADRRSRARGPYTQQRGTSAVSGSYPRYTQ